MSQSTTDEDHLEALQMQQRAVETRSKRADTSTRTFMGKGRRGHSDPSIPMPTIAACFSGGGPRAMLSTVSVLDGLSQCGLLDCVTYAVGLSGSTWCLLPWAAHPNPAVNPFHDDRMLDPWQQSSSSATPMAQHGTRFSLEKTLSFFVEGDSLSRQKLVMWGRDLLGNWEDFIVSKYLLRTFADKDAIPHFSSDEVRARQMSGDYPIILCSAISDDVSNPVEYEWVSISCFVWQSGGRIWDARDSRNDRIAHIMSVCGSAFAFDKTSTPADSLLTTSIQPIRNWFRETTAMLECVPFFRNVRATDITGTMRDAGIQCNIPLSIVPQGTNIVLVFDSSEDVEGTFSGAELSKAQISAEAASYAAHDSYDAIRVIKPTSAGEAFIVYIPTLRHVATEGSFLMPPDAVRAMHDGLVDAITNRAYVDTVRNVVRAWQRTVCPTRDSAAVSSSSPSRRRLDRRRPSAAVPLDLRESLKVLYAEVYRFIGITSLETSQDLFQNIWTPLRANWGDVGSTNTTLDMSDIWRQLRGRNVTQFQIEGCAGSGKSTTVKALARNQEDTAHPIVVVSLLALQAYLLSGTNEKDSWSRLQSWDSTLDVLFCIVTESFPRKVALVDVDRVVRELRSHPDELLWILDGLDEVQDNPLVVSIVGRCLANLTNVCVTSRHERNIRARNVTKSMPSFSLLPWNRQRIEEYIDRFFDACDESLIAKRDVAKKIILGDSMAMFHGLPLICEFVCALFASSTPVQVHTPTAIFERVISMLKSRYLQRFHDATPQIWEAGMQLLRGDQPVEIDEGSPIIHTGLIVRVGRRGNHIVCRAVHESIRDYVRASFLGSLPWPEAQRALVISSEQRLVLLFLTHILPVASLRLFVRYLSSELYRMSRQKSRDVSMCDMNSCSEREGLRAMLSVDTIVECVSHCPPEHRDDMTDLFLNSGWSRLRNCLVLGYGRGGSPHYYKLLVEPAARYHNERMLKWLVKYASCGSREFLDMAMVQACTTEATNNLTVRKYLEARGCRMTLEMILRVGNTKAFDHHYVRSDDVEEDIWCAAEALRHGQLGLFNHIELELFNGHVPNYLFLRDLCRIAASSKLQHRLEDWRDLVPPDSTHLPFYNMELDTASMMTMVQKCKSLVTVDLSSTAETVTDEVVRCLLQISTLKDLNLSDCELLTPSAFLVANTTTSADLTRLNLSRCSDAIVSVCPVDITPSQSENTVALLSEGELENSETLVTSPQLADGVAKPSIHIVLSACAVTALQTLEVDGCDDLADNSLGSVWSLCPHLTSLTISNSRRVTDKGFHLNPTARRPPLRTLNISQCRSITDAGIEAIVTNFPNLSSLSASECWNLTDEGLGAVARLTRLTSLDISGCGKVTDVGVSLIAKRCVQLSSADVGECAMITDKAAKDLMARCSVLSLAGCVLVTDAAFDARPTRQAALTSLKLSWCRNVTDKGIQSLLRHNPDGLVHLDVSRCTMLTSRAMSQLCTAHRLTLRSLNVSLCRGIDAGVALAAARGRALSELTLSWCRSLNDVTLKGIMEHCGANLVVLDVAQCTRITDDSLISISQEAARLRRLDVSGCIGVSDLGIAAVVRGCRALDSLRICGCVGLTDATGNLLLEHANDCRRSRPYLKVVEASDCTGMSRHMMKLLID
eukprot:PhM_4_TR17419/c0_g1_i1/m.29403